jgi:hypothetical protein
MNLLNVSLCLPELDIVALREKHSIVVITKRFIVPDKSFVLLPCRELLNDLPLTELYQAQWLDTLKNKALPASNQLQATHWAQCVFCHQLTEESAITTIAERTIWTATALLQHLRNRDSLFLSFLQVYELPKSIPIATAPTCEQLYKFLPLPNYLEVTTQTAILSSKDFAAKKAALLDSTKPDDEPVKNDVLKPAETDHNISASTGDDRLNSPDWFTQIAEIGNSSDGHTFEKFVRKALLELGFRNSKNHLKTSLDPKATGGAGGLDFYADTPYPIVGECKATASQKINSDAATQLVRLGLQNLTPNDYHNCIKIIISAGTMTAGANQIAEGHCINVIRPETLQSLVELKIKREDLVNLNELKDFLKGPFGELADNNIKNFIRQGEETIEGNKQRYQGMQIIKSIKELSEQTIHGGRKSFFASEIRAHYNAKYQPHVTDEYIQETLTAFTAPWLGYLAKTQLPEGQERFSFVRDMPII